jgi:predicted metalloprotease with PDZ domain
MLPRRVVLIGLLSMMPAIAAGCPCCCTTAAETPAPKGAGIGVESRAATAEEAKTYGLDQLKGCPAGQFVSAVEKGGPAEKAGLQAGDMLVALDANKFYSRDDLDDFLRVSEPGAKVKATVKRAGTFKEETLTVTLGASTKAASNGQFRWQYAGVGQLDQALAAAKKANKPVLVGLSGAET